MVKMALDEISKRSEMNKTIIDILKVADQERFHSSMVAWMLDPRGEHGYGHEFASRLFSPIPQLAHEQVVQVDVEKSDGGVRYDILLTMQSGRRIALENKTKSFGGASQLLNYKRKLGPDAVVALGFDKLNYDAEWSGTIPLITYSDILIVMEGLGDNVDDNGFYTITRHYRSFLARELGRLEKIREGFQEEKRESLLEIVEMQKEWIRSNDNNRRFYNSYYLALVRDRLIKRVDPGVRWVLIKDVQSGVVMYQANPAEDEHPHWALEAKYRDNSILSESLLQFRRADGT